jgi:glutathione S-transferase
MSGKIYLIQDDDTLLEMVEKTYDSEDILQTLLEKYPDLLAGEQMDADEGRRWLLISREVGVPGQQDGSDRWSLDHLFLDQDGVLTLVEV